ncbi:Zinc finger BED domain-containing-like protein [Daphnia magna]|uniref:Zinc finger BED domain-containing-like protein n=1 Tax=Daphnia magna TaxID=35525 RepID=A0A164KY99_9CRUS|nr:Zinc finger BED domain-containing-like protein [Daphnia magna]
MPLNEPDKKERRLSIEITEKQVVDACVEMVTVNGRPFKALSDSGFRKILDPILKGLGGNITISPENIRDKVEGKAKEIRDQVKKDGINLQFKKGKIQLYTVAIIEVKKSPTALNFNQNLLDVFGVFEISKFNSTFAKNLLKHMKKRLSVLLKSEVVLAALYLDPRYNYYFIFAVCFLTTPHPPILFRYNVMLEEDQLKAAQKHLMKLWRLIESNKNDPPANTPSLLQTVQPNENKVGLTNDELQEILFKKEAERRKKK